MEIEDCFFDASDYKIPNKKLGEGAFGKVYIVESQNSDILYAAKIINTNGVFNSRDQMMFLRESLILYKLSHPAIVKFKGINFHSFEDPSMLSPTILMEYYTNGSLKVILDKEKKSIADDNWSPTKKYICLLGISDALRYLHKAGILHRDLKPQNILIDSNYYPKVCDFGYSRCFSNSLTNSMQLSMTGNVGTPLYMAPELYEDEQHYGPAVDVYAFAILAYEIVTRIEPFLENGKPPTFSELIRKVMNGERPKFINGINANMKDLIEKCWSQNPKERPSFDEIFEMLSSDFSYSDETVDEDEINEYLETLKESRDVTKQESDLNKLKDELALKNEETKNLQIEIDKLKSENQSYKTEIKNLHDELDKLRSSNSSGDSKCLHIKICEANKILSLRPFQKPDAYVTLRLKSQSNGCSTLSYSKSNNPVWNEEFDLISSEKDDFLIINMFDEDSKGDEKLMNQIELPVDDFTINDQVIRKEIDLMLKKKKAGTLILEVQALPSNGKKSSASENLNNVKIDWDSVTNVNLLMISGDCSGKTTLLNRFADGIYKPDLATIGVNFKVRNIEINGHSVKVQIWDTASQEKFNNITKANLKFKHGILMCFDVTRKDSLKSVIYWVDEFKAMNLDHKIPIALVGNMIDDDHREVSYDEGAMFAHENGWGYFETSAKKNIGVEEPFRFVVMKYLKNRNNR